MAFKIQWLFSLFSFHLVSSGKNIFKGKNIQCAVCFLPLKDVCIYNNIINTWLPETV